jgi:hypothetical protein
MTFGPTGGIDKRQPEKSSIPTRLIKATVRRCHDQPFDEDRRLCADLLDARIGSVGSEADAGPRCRSRRARNGHAAGFRTLR